MISLLRVHLNHVLLFSRWHAFFHLDFGPFSFYIHPQHFPQYVFFISPYTFPDLLEACATLVVPQMCSFLILSLRVTPHIHRSILISFTSIRFSCRFVVAHDSFPLLTDLNVSIGVHACGDLLPNKATQYLVVCELQSNGNDALLVCLLVTVLIDTRFLAA